VELQSLLHVYLFQDVHFLHLQEDLMRSRKQWQDHRERLLATEGELGHLSGIRDRSEALQAELTSALSRLAATESECSRLRGDVERWQGAAGESDDKSLTLQNALREAESRAAEQARALADCKKECESLAAQVSSAEATHSTLQIDLEQARLGLQCREETLAGERSRVQELEFKLRSIEHHSETEKQRLSVKDEELRRLKVLHMT
jgi:predicted  nucleic acid-binding Zn-ribbon protein